jgi:NADPH-ferrihemoprotein reductase
VFQQHGLTAEVEQDIQSRMGDQFEMVTAFSREGPTKIYVQQRLREKGSMVNELIQRNASFYVCGDAATMAKDVNSTLITILADQRGVSHNEAVSLVKEMRNSNRYQVRS